MVGSPVVGIPAVGSPVEVHTLVEGTLEEGMHPWEGNPEEEGHQPEPAADCSNSSLLKIKELGGIVGKECDGCFL